MKLHHAAVWVTDVKYFGATANNLYENKTTGFRSYFLSFDSGGQLEIYAPY